MKLLLALATLTLAASNFFMARAFAQSGNADTVLANRALLEKYIAAKSSKDIGKLTDMYLSDGLAFLFLPADRFLPKPTRESTQRFSVRSMAGSICLIPRTTARSKP